MTCAWNAEICIFRWRENKLTSPFRQSFLFEPYFDTTLSIAFLPSLYNIWMKFVYSSFDLIIFQKFLSTNVCFHSKPPTLPKNDLSCVEPGKGAWNLWSSDVSSAWMQWPELVMIICIIWNAILNPILEQRYSPPFLFLNFLRRPLNSNDPVATWHRWIGGSDLKLSS